MKRLMVSWMVAIAVGTSGAMANTSIESSHSNKVESSDNYKDRNWITIGADAYQLISQQHSEMFDMKSVQMLESNNAKVALVNIANTDLVSLSEFMHDNFKRCGGYAMHSSLGEAQAFVAGSHPIVEPQSYNYTINNSATVNALFSAIVPNNMSATVNSLSNYNNRFYQQSSGVEAASWIKEHWSGIAASRTDISVEFFEHPNWQQPSVIATITGSSQPDEIVVIGGHLDSINGGNPSTGRAPGEDDNASGIAVVTETLSAIVASDYRPAKTIKLMGYAAEEVGLRGSQAIANTYRNAGENVIGVAQFDMTGFFGTPSQRIVFMSDYTNSAQNTYMGQLIDAYLPNTTYGFDPCGYACSDHASWHSKGFAASFPFESRSSDYNSRIHTSNDNTFDEAHATHFLKLAVAYAAELAKGSIGNEPAPAVGALTFSDTSIELEEGTSITINIARVDGMAQAISVDFSTVDGSAIAGTDYTATSGNLSWADNDNADKSIEVTALTVDSDKTFSLVLSNPQGGSVLGQTDSISVTIKNKVETETPETTTSSSGGGAFGGLTLMLLLFSRLFAGTNSRANAKK